MDIITRTARAAWLVIAVMGVAGCSNITDTVTLGTIGATLVGGQSPTHELEQIYYLGVFDPQEQIPPTVYRVRVHGQASFISFMRFGSGWVPAQVIDSLGTGVGFDDAGNIEITPAGGEAPPTFETGRGLMMFGPEGFRPAPRNHRLVVVMGSNPEAFFSAVDETLGAVAGVMAEQRDAELQQ